MICRLTTLTALARPKWKVKASTCTTTRPKGQTCTSPSDQTWYQRGPRSKPSSTTGPCTRSTTRPGWEGSRTNCSLENWIQLHVSDVVLFYFPKGRAMTAWPESLELRLAKSRRFIRINSVRFLGQLKRWMLKYREHVSDQWYSFFPYSYRQRCSCSQRCSLIHLRVCCWVYS